MPMSVRQQNPAGAPARKPAGDQQRARIRTFSLESRRWVDRDLAEARESKMASDAAGQHQEPGLEEYVVLASFVSRRAAEHMLISLGHKFRHASSKGRASALVVSANPDGSLKLTQSRAQTAEGVSAALIRLPVSWMIGFLGLLSTFKGIKTTTHAAQVHEKRVGSDEHAAHAILAEAGGKSAIALVRCRDEQMWRDIGPRADHRAIHTWHGPMTEFRADLDPGSQHDWVRTALDKTTT
jgi:hypothetical protein